MSKLATLNWAYSDEILSKHHKTYRASRGSPMAERHRKKLATAIIPPVAKRLIKLQMDKMHKNILNR